MSDSNASTKGKDEIDLNNLLKFIAQVVSTSTKKNQHSGCPCGKEAISFCRNCYTPLCNNDIFQKRCNDGYVHFCSSSCHHVHTKVKEIEIESCKKIQQLKEAHEEKIARIEEESALKKAELEQRILNENMLELAMQRMRGVRYNRNDKVSNDASNHVEPKEEEN